MKTVQHFLVTKATLKIVQQNLISWDICIKLLQQREVWFMDLDIRQIKTLLRR